MGSVQRWLLSSGCSTQKSSKVFSNRKPWCEKPGDVSAQSSAYRSGDLDRTVDCHPASQEWVQPARWGALCWQQKDDKDRNPREVWHTRWAPPQRGSTPIKRQAPNNDETHYREDIQQLVGGWSTHFFPSTGRRWSCWYRDISTHTNTAFHPELWNPLPSSSETLLFKFLDFIYTMQTTKSCEKLISLWPVHW